MNSDFIAIAMKTKAGEERRDSLGGNQRALFPQASKIMERWADVVRPLTHNQYSFWILCRVYITYRCLSASANIIPKFFFYKLSARVMLLGLAAFQTEWPTDMVLSLLPTPSRKKTGRVPYGCKGLAALLLSFSWAFLQEVSKVQNIV